VSERSAAAGPARNWDVSDQVGQWIYNDCSILKGVIVKALQELSLKASNAGGLTATKTAKDTSRAGEVKVSADDPRAYFTPS